MQQTCSQYSTSLTHARHNALPTISTILTADALEHRIVRTLAAHLTSLAVEIELRPYSSNPPLPRVGTVTAGVLTTSHGCNLLNSSAPALQEQAAQGRDIMLVALTAYKIKRFSLLCVLDSFQRCSGRAISYTNFTHAHLHRFSTRQDRSFVCSSRHSFPNYDCLIKFDHAPFDHCHRSFRSSLRWFHCAP